MKIKYLLIVIFMVGSSFTYAQNDKLSSLFEKYENEDNVTVVSISKAMFKMIPGNISTGNVDIKNIVPKIESLLIITTDKNEMKTKMYSDFKSTIDKDKDFEELMRVKEGKSNITFNAKKKGDIIKELVMLVNDDEDFVAIRILGNFTVEDVQSIAKDHTQ